MNPAFNALAEAVFAATGDTVAVIYTEGGDTAPRCRSLTAIQRDDPAWLATLKMRAIMVDLTRPVDPEVLQLIVRRPEHYGKA